MFNLKWRVYRIYAWFKYRGWQKMPESTKWNIRRFMNELEDD